MLIAFFWEVKKYISYKKLVLSKHLNKGVIEEIKYNVPSLTLARFVGITAILVFAHIEYMVFSQSSRFLLSSIVELILDKPWVCFLLFSITFGITLSVIPWKDLIRGFTINNWKNRGQHWIRHLLLVVSFAIFSIFLIMLLCFDPKLTLNQKQASYQMKGKDKFF